MDELQSAFYDNFIYGLGSMCKLSRGLKLHDEGRPALTIWVEQDAL